MLFIILVAFSALFVAGCAAFFSIKGLITLFSGSALAIGVMASSLEIGKLVAASFLHTYWKHTKFLLKVYLCSAVFILMCITSLGIFGFLTNAYQVHSAKVNTFDTKIESLVHEKNTLDQATLEHRNRIQALTELRATQEQRIQAAGNYKAPREQAYKAIAEANDEIQRKEEEVAKNRQKATELDKEISELKISLNTTTDIGSFKFIADALHVDVDTAVQYFIFMLIGVFDPLAVALVISWNKLIEQRRIRKKQEDTEYIDMLNARVAEPAPVAIKQPEEPKLAEVIKPELEVEREPVAQEVVAVESKITQVEDKQEEIEEEIISIEHIVQCVATDIVSNMPIADIDYTEELENDPEFQKLPEDQKEAARAKRRVFSGDKNTVIRVS